MPEMVFGENELRVEHDGGFKVWFKARDALAMVDNKTDKLKVSYADIWAKSRYFPFYVSPASILGGSNMSCTSFSFSLSFPLGDRRPWRVSRMWSSLTIGHSPLGMLGIMAIFRDTRFVILHLKFSWGRGKKFFFFRFFSSFSFLFFFLWRPDSLR